MTSTPPLSEIIRALEQLAGRNGELLRDALALVQQAAAAEDAIYRTAVDAVGPDRASTVVDLVRLPVAAGIADTLSAMRRVLEGMPGGRSVASGIVSEPEARPFTAVYASAVQPRPEKTEICGIEIPAGRKADAEEVVTAARSAAAQNRKTNPFEHHRGKNSWKKALFVAALGQAAAEEPEALETAAVQTPSTPASAPIPLPEASPGQDPIRDRADDAPRLTASAQTGQAGQLRGSPSSVPPVSGTVTPASGRPHGHGVAVQKISEDQVKDVVAVPPRQRNPFFKRAGR